MLFERSRHNPATPEKYYSIFSKRKKFAKIEKRKSNPVPKTDTFCASAPRPPGEVRAIAFRNFCIDSLFNHVIDCLYNEAQ